jgi:hypothetical protein
MFRDIIDKCMKDGDLNKIIHHDIQHICEEFHKALMNEALFQKAIEEPTVAKFQ